MTYKHFCFPCIFSKLPDLKLSSVPECGQSTGTRIVNGQDADRDEYPWQVAIVRTGESNHPMRCYSHIRHLHPYRPALRRVSPVHKTTIIHDVSPVQKTNSALRRVSPVHKTTIIHDVSPVQKTTIHDVSPVQKTTIHDVSPVQKTTIHDVSPVQKTTIHDVSPVQKTTIHDVSPVEKKNYN